MKQLHIGLDVDGVIADFHTAFRHFAARKLGRSVEELIAPTQWDWYKDWGISKAEWWTLYRWFIDEGCLKQLPVIAGAPEGLAALRAAGHHIHIITARGIQGEEYLCNQAARDTLTWLFMRGLPYDSISFTVDKWRVPVDVLLDDAPDHLSATGPMCAAICFDQPFNRQWPGFRVSDWPDFLILVERWQANGDFYGWVARHKAFAVRSAGQWLAPNRINAAKCSTLPARTNQSRPEVDYGTPQT